MSIEFVSVRGRVYTPVTVKPLVMAAIRKRVPECIRKPGWEDRVATVLASNSDWLRHRNGCVPSALARDLEDLVLDAPAPTLDFYLRVLTA